MDDTELIAAVQAGARDAFGALVERYQRTLYYLVVGKVAQGASESAPSPGNGAAGVVLANGKSVLFL